MQNIYGIYVPGLGDHRSMGQDKAIADWQKLGFELTYFPLHWGDKKDFKPKLQSLLDEIDRLHTETGSQIVLIGSSAGASAILHAYAKRKNSIRSAVCICGKIRNPQTIGEHVYRNNPAFKQSMQQLPATLGELEPNDRRKIISVHSLYDGRVPVADTYIEGAKELTIHTVGHVFSIGFALSLGKKKIAKFIRAM